jgi:hypothetical protein
MSIAFKTEKYYDEHTPKISYSKISKSEKSLSMPQNSSLWEKLIVISQMK